MPGARRHAAASPSSLGGGSIVCRGLRDFTPRSTSRAGCETTEFLLHHRPGGSTCTARHPWRAAKVSRRREATFGDRPTQHVARPSEAIRARRQGQQPWSSGCLHAPCAKRARARSHRGNGARDTRRDTTTAIARPERPADSSMLRSTIPLELLDGGDSVAAIASGEARTSEQRRRRQPSSSSFWGHGPRRRLPRRSGSLAEPTRTTGFGSRLETEML